MSEIVTQVCNECKEELPMFEFGFSPTRGTHFTKCKACTKKRKKTWYHKDPHLAFNPWKSKKRRNPCS